MILLASCIAQEASGSDSPPPVDTIDGVYNESQQAYNTIAQLAGYQSIQAVLEIFAQKMIGNLMHSAKKSSQNHAWIVD